MAAEPREVQSIWWNGANGDATILAVEGRTLTWTQEYHGDHECEWVIERVGGYEVARHNARYIASITWKPEAQMLAHSNRQDAE